MDISFFRQAASFAGALLVLIAYIGHQRRWINSRSLPYNLMNAAGSGILAYVAFHPFQIGFVVLEGVWAIISLYSLLRPARQ
jgi:xanthine/uracil/vitamin C permease (AzgA family)